MVIAESKWPKDIKRWRIVRRILGEVVSYHCQANLSFMGWGKWQDLGPHETANDDGDDCDNCESRLWDWVQKQCEEDKKVEETVVWKGKKDGFSR